MGSGERVTADRGSRRHRVLLLSMPFSSLHFPSIGLSLLKPALEAEGIEVKLRYEFLRFADMIGAANQALIDEQGIYHSLVGEWIFAAEAHDRDLLDLSYLTEILQQRFGSYFSLERMHAVLTARERAADFLDACLDAVERDAPDIVGFTTSFQQNCASLALARRIKARRPATVIVFGGANCRGEMGIELLANTTSSTPSASTRATARSRPTCVAFSPALRRAYRRHDRARARDGRGRSGGPR